MEKVLVTGANGFLGAHLCVALAKAFPSTTIYALKRASSNTQFAEQLFTDAGINSTRVKWLEGNVAPFDLYDLCISDFDVVYHTAALVNLKKGGESALLNTNYKGTKNLVNFCLEKQIPKLIYVSSIAAITAEAGLKKGFSHQKIERNNAYGLSKFLGEVEVIRGKEEGLEIGILRPAVILGKAPKYNALQKTFKAIAKGPYITGMGSMPYVHVADVCQQLIQMLDKNTTKAITAVTGNVLFSKLFQLVCNKPSPPKLLTKRKLMWLSKILAFITWPLPLKNPLPKNLVGYLSEHTEYTTEGFLENQPKLGIEQCLLDTK